MGLSNYPPGLSDYSEDAPWNEPFIPEKNFEVTISQTFSKTVTVTTDDYLPERDFDEDTGSCYTYANTDETDWKQAYEEQHFKIQDLLSELKQYVLEDMKNTGKNTGRGKHLEELLAACDGWTEDEVEVIRD